MTERLPDSGETNWADVLGAGDSTGGFLRVGHEDDGTLKPISATVGGVPDGWTLGASNQLTINPNAAGSTSATATSLAVQSTKDGSDVLQVNYDGINSIPIHVTVPSGGSAVGLHVSTQEPNTNSMLIGTFGGTTGAIRIAGTDCWLVFGAVDNAPTTSDLSNHECAMWYDENVPSIKFLAKTGETGEIILT